jgi:hypothetical protein
MKMKFISYLPICNLACCIARQDPVKDLTRYGIEPNPCPKQKGNKTNKPPQKGKKSQPAKQTRKGYAPGLMKALGQTAGTFLGGPLGGQMGARAGSWFGKITGLGSYKLNRNNLMTDNGPPVFGNTGQGMTICHREFLQDITSTTGFSLTSFPINSGLTSTFPWLANVAINFEQYEFLGLVFSYRPTSATSVGSTNTAQGTVIMATDYDTHDSTFSSKQQMEAYEFSTSCAPFNEMLHPIECQPRFNTLARFFTRSGAVPTGADTNFYDLGNFQIATVGMQASAVIGELWVTYQVRLLKPKLPTPLGAGLIGAHIVESPATAVTTAAPLGSGGGVTRSGSLLGSVTSPSTFTLPQPGQYLISYSLFTSTINAAPQLTVGSNITKQRLFNDNGAVEFFDFHTNTSGYYVTVVNVSNGGFSAANVCTLVLSGVTAGQCDLFIQQTSSGLGAPITVLERLKLVESYICKRKDFLLRLEEEAKDDRNDDRHQWSQCN